MSVPEPPQGITDLWESWTGIVSTVVGILVVVGGVVARTWHKSHVKPLADAQGVTEKKVERVEAKVEKVEEKVDKVEGALQEQDRDIRDFANAQQRVAVENKEELQKQEQKVDKHGEKISEIDNRVTENTTHLKHILRDKRADG